MLHPTLIRLRALAALALIAALTACGGGDGDDIAASTCLVDGHPAPVEACR